MNEPTQGTLQLPDYFMIGGYFILMLAIGAYFYRYMRGMKDYLREPSLVAERHLILHDQFQCFRVRL